MGSETLKARWSQTVEPEGASPVWGEDRVPRCTEDCPSHDGKHCKLIGFRAPDICEPTVAEMARALYETEPSTKPTRCHLCQCIDGEHAHGCPEEPAPGEGTPP
jgi:hypothetical protein